MPAEVGFFKNLFQMLHRAIVADGNQNAARTCLQLAGIGVRLMIEIKLFKPLFL